MTEVWAYETYCVFFFMFNQDYYYKYWYKALFSCLIDLIFLLIQLNFKKNYEVDLGDDLALLKSKYNEYGQLDYEYSFSSAPKLLIVKLKIIVVEAPKHVVQMQTKEKVKGQRHTNACMHTHTHKRIILGQTKCVGAMTFFKFKLFTYKGLLAQMATGWTMQHLLRDIVQLGSRKKLQKIANFILNNIIKKKWYVKAMSCHIVSCLRSCFTCIWGFQPTGEMKYCISFIEVMNRCEPDWHFFFFLSASCHTPLEIFTRLALTTRTSSSPARLFPASVLSSSPGHHRTMPRFVSFFVCHTKRRVLVTCSENEKESGSRGERQERKNEKKKAIFMNCCRLLSIPLLIVRIPNQQCSLENIISCSKQELKNNISHGNLGSGECHLTSTSDYWCIFNKVKDLQWCMWLPF